MTHSQNHKRRFTLVELIALGAVLGEIGFSFFFSPAEDYWQHYQAARAFLAQLPIQDYNYPAATAMFFLPFAALPRGVSFVAWLLSIYLIFAVALALMGLSRTQILIWLAWPHVFISGFVGQVDCLVLLAVALASRFRIKSPFWGGFMMGLGLVKFHLLLPLVILVWHRRQYLEFAGLALAATVFVTISLLLPQSYPGRLDYILGYYPRHHGSVGIPARLSDLPIQWWLGIVVLLGLGWLWLVAANRLAAWVTLPVVHPYFPSFDLSVIIPVLAQNRYAPFFYILVGMPVLFNQFIPLWILAWIMIGALLIGGVLILIDSARRNQSDIYLR